MAVDDAECCTPFGMAVSAGQVGLHDQSVAVFHQGLPHEAQHRTGAGRVPEQPRVRISGRGMGGVRALPAPE